MYLKCAGLVLVLASITGCDIEINADDLRAEGGNSDEIIDLGEKFTPDALYSFDEDSGTTAENSKSDVLHGVIVGASRVEGKMGRALDFSQVEGAHVRFNICCDGHPDTNEGGMLVTFPNDSFTIASWLKPKDMTTDTIYPVFGGWYGSVQSMKVRIKDGGFNLLIYPENNGNEINLISSSYVLPNEQWTHFAVTYDGMQALIYINGELDNYSSITIPVEDIHNDYFIGGIPSIQSSGPGKHSFPGLIDEFFMSQNALKQVQIQGLISN